MAVTARDFERLVAFVGFLESLCHALSSLLEGLEGLLELLWDVSGDLDGSEGGLLVSWQPSWEDLGALWSPLERSWGLLNESWRPHGSLLGAFWTLFEGTWTSFQSL